MPDFARLATAISFTDWIIKITKRLPDPVESYYFTVQQEFPSTLQVLFFIESCMLFL